MNLTVSQMNHNYTKMDGEERVTLENNILIDKINYRSTVF